MKRALPIGLLALAAALTPGAQAQMFGNPSIPALCNSWYMSTLDACRDFRDGQHSKVWSIYVDGATPIPVAVCTDGASDPFGEEVSPDPLELAKQQCNRHNVTLKKDLKECFSDGIGIKTNFDVDKACPKGNMVDVHQITDDAACELSNPTENKDAGNGFFSTCTATGPGPAGPPMASWTPWAHTGCCKVAEIQRGDRGFELDRVQGMTWTWGKNQSWNEDYYAGTEKHEIWTCNPPDWEDGKDLLHYYCAETSQDIMVEGWQNPEENSGHQGPGWCNVTTGTYMAGGTSPVDQIFSDIAKAIQYIGEPKGIIGVDNNYDPAQPHPKYMCALRRDAFDTHCSNAEIVSTNQFAHSMGAIASAVWGLPFDFFGGAVTGPPQSYVTPHGVGGGMRNNCDPVPAIVDYMHPYAIYFYAKQHMNTPTGGVGNYRWCNGADITTDCVRRNATYAGRPKGPDGCGPNGTTCEYAAWCDWHPYAGTRQEHSGREGYAPKRCQKAAKAVIDEVRECLEDDGLSQIISCLEAAYDTTNLIRKFPKAVEDHGFDDKKDWGGYRVLTKPNWDVPRRQHLRGAIPPDDPGGGGDDCDNPPPPGSGPIPVCEEQ